MARYIRQTIPDLGNGYICYVEATVALLVLQLKLALVIISSGCWLDHHGEHLLQP